MVNASESADWLQLVGTQSESFLLSPCERRGECWTLSQSMRNRPMDPEANLKEQLELAKEIIAVDDSGDDPEDAYQSAVRLAELVIALAEWNAKGGHVGR